MDYSSISFAALDQRWLRAWGGVAGTGGIRQQVDDFIVEELPLATPQGEGEHLWLWVEKAGANTAWVARQLAQQAGIRSRDVSYAGRKDRHARTRQFFSLHLAGVPDPAWEQWQIQNVTILSAARHTKKLRRGALAGNRFRLVIRDLDAPQPLLEQRLEQIAQYGVPNYFGPQRFGRNGANIYRAGQLLTVKKRFPRDIKNILVSAARSVIFNDVLAARVAGGTWNHLQPADVVQLAGSRTRFTVDEPNPELLQRCSDFDITPTGPLPGDESPQAEAAMAVEAAVLEEHAEWVTALRRMRVEADRRPLRVQASELHWQHGPGTLELQFELVAGAYATAVLRELLDCTDDPDKGRPNGEAI
jgi:tRNA pseudouridine13 synthase